MNNLKNERLQALLTQKELAEQAGVSTRTVINAERGEPIRVRTRRKLLNALALPIECHEEVFGPVIPSEQETT